MSGQDAERERIQRIRERQISARDPKKKDREFQQKIAGRHKKEKLTVVGVIQDIPGKWLGMILGGILGITVALVVIVLLRDKFPWIEWVGYVIILACVVMGRGFGAAMDWRDEDHDALVKRG